MCVPHINSLITNSSLALLKEKRCVMAFILYDKCRMPHQSASQRKDIPLSTSLLLKRFCNG